MKLFENRRLKGAVSIFLVIITIPCLLLSAVLIDGSRLSSARAMTQEATDLAAASILASYDQTLKDEANASIQTMADYTVTEAQIENLVIAKGYTDCVAFIGENALSLAVAAPEGGLTDADTARIVDVVNQTAGFSADQVKIIAVEE